ncbi:MAG: DHA1 family bicyclomycin/chloramphenicol resistance-like MFS transporter [Bacteriovoracaceae bacterium]|jgi:DHA1 family bicyclomycin/chloramphenicol resistance-like MFS transporter
MKNQSWGFIALMALLMSFVALAIDAMLPALGQIAIDLNVENRNDVQQVISSIFLGMSFGLIFFGPFSDSYGRKPAIYLGMSIFIIGCLISIFSQSFNMMILGRILQGLGGASCRVITIAMIRDKFEGAEMGKVMSLIMIFFIMVPALAPSIGQLILLIASWRAIFYLMLLLGVISMIWLALKQEETLALDKRLNFSLGTIWNGVIETVKNKVSRSYTLAAAFVFGAFISYLSSSQQIFQTQYGVGKLFSLYFGVLALSIGSASFANSRWLERHSMETLCLQALKFMVVFGLVFFPIALYFKGNPPLPILMIYLMGTFFTLGILFGNFNTLAIQPLGHIAGVANSVISSIQTFISVLIGGTISHFYDGSILPIVASFLGLGFISLLIVRRTINTHLLETARNS